MKDISGELLYLLLFAVVVLGQYLFQWLRRDRGTQQDEPRAEDRQEARNPATDELPAIQIPAPVPFVPHPVAQLPTYRDKSDRSAVQQHALVRAPKRFSRAALLGSKRRRQDAVVAAVILGPCRAYAPHDSGQ